ncbi:IclR family transcriptional regulator [Parapusillimonas sp. JC17]|uniref:IclR family transcriptional regulator n=1 Tax=Parapusillimonas sp. JC17 TaxID=3445768 RepID=UPI003FA024F2
MQSASSSPFDTMNGTPIPGAQSVQRVAMLMRVLALHHRDGLRLVDIARLTGLERPSAHRMLQAMVSLGLAAQIERRYFLGASVFELAAIASPEFDLRDIAGQSAKALAEQVEDTVYVTVQNGLDAVCIERCVGRYPIRIFTLDVGDRRPMGVGAGSITMLAAMPIQEADAIITANAGRYAEYEGVTEENVRGFVQGAREKGYVARLGRINPEVKTLAVAVTLATGRPAAGISVAAIESRIPTAREAQLVDQIRMQGEAIRDALQRVARI